MPSSGVSEDRVYSYEKKKRKESLFFFFEIYLFYVCEYTVVGSGRLKDGAGVVAVNNTTVQVLARIWCQPLPSRCMQIKVLAD